MSETILTLNSATFRFNKEEIFPNTSLSLKRGELLQCIGLNEVHNEIFLKVLSKKISPIKGEVSYSIKNKEISLVDLKSHRKLIRDDLLLSSRWESSFKDLYLSVRDYLSSYKLLDSSFNEVIELLGVGNLLNRNLTSLSNGEGRKLSLVISLLSNPKVILISEPFLGLDKKSKIILSNLLKTLLSKKISVVVTISNKEDILRWDSSYFFIEKKRVKKIKTREEAINLLTLKKSLELKKIDDNFLKEKNPLVLELKDINLSYEEVEILKNVNLEVYKKDKVLLLGDNGSGKSSLISLITGDNPKSYINDIRFLNKKRREEKNIWDFKRKSGLVSGDLFNILPYNNSCLDIVLSGINNTPEFIGEPSSKQIELALSLMSFFEIDNKRNEPFYLQKGIKKWLLLLARALMSEPLILILDEPVEDLDRENRLKFIDFVINFSTINMLPFILTTHRYEKLPSAINKVFILKNGRLLNY